MHLPNPKHLLSRPIEFPLHMLRPSFGPSSKEFFALAKLTRWVIYGTPSDEFKKANVDFHPIYMTPFDGFVR